MLCLIYFFFSLQFSSVRVAMHILRNGLLFFVQIWNNSVWNFILFFLFSCTDCDMMVLNCVYFLAKERIPIEEVFDHLKCTREGLTTSEGEKRLQIFGPNKLEEKKESKILKFLGFMWNPLSWVMECAALMAIVLANGGVIIITRGRKTTSIQYMYMYYYLSREFDNTLVQCRESRRIGKTSSALSFF